MLKTGAGAGFECTLFLWVFSLWSGFPHAPGEVLCGGGARGISILTVELWGSFLDVQEEATVFLRPKPEVPLTSLVYEQRRIQSRCDIKYQILF